ncbi:hypothetical protein [Streptomyces sp. SD15]
MPNRPCGEGRSAPRPRTFGIRQRTVQRHQLRHPVRQGLDRWRLAHQGLLRVVLIALALASADDTLGVGKLWAKLPFVRNSDWLR